MVYPTYKTSAVLLFYSSILHYVITASLPIKLIPDISPDPISIFNDGGNV